MAVTHLSYKEAQFVSTDWNFDCPAMTIGGASETQQRTGFPYSYCRSLGLFG